MECSERFRRFEIEDEGSRVTRLCWRQPRRCTECGTTSIITPAPSSSDAFRCSFVLAEASIWTSTTDDCRAQCRLN
eukprot:1911604-Rhodomonas_salina.2